jgi:hypothetical protein
MTPIECSTLARTLDLVRVTCGALETRRPLSNEPQAWHLISGALSQCDPRGTCKRTERHAEHGGTIEEPHPLTAGNGARPPWLGYVH